MAHGYTTLTSEEVRIAQEYARELEYRSIIALAGTDRAYAMKLYQGLGQALSQAAPKAVSRP